MRMMFCLSECPGVGGLVEQTGPSVWTVECIMTHL